MVDEAARAFEGRRSQPHQQGLTFGEIADEYDRFRPSYPDALFDAVIEYGSLRAGDAALEIGAGTGKATRGFTARGLAVHALEPSPGMARVLRATGVEVEETKFEDWEPRNAAFRLALAAQAWHWVHDAQRYAKVATALAPGGTLALFWNKGRELPEPLRADNDAAYEEHAPGLTSATGNWELDRTLDEIAAVDGFGPPTKRVFTWYQTYTTREWLELLGTHSDHRILPEAQRVRLHAAVGHAVNRHGGRVDITYDATLYLATRN
jgi:SAM-dependent methyltransferase